MFGQNDNNQDQNQAFNPAIPNSHAPDPAQDNPGSYDDPAAPASSFNQNEFNNSNLPPANQTPPQAPISTDGNDLLGIKQQALQQLSPLVGQLEQSPEEKFRTTMMMIQASDDQSLIKTAYESAQQITDEKARAQALLDVVNEINYFTQQRNNNS